eukprot:915552-Rhodomonas_salina.2
MEAHQCAAAEQINVPAHCKESVCARAPRAAEGSSSRISWPRRERRQLMSARRTEEEERERSDMP